MQFKFFTGGALAALAAALAITAVPASAREPDQYEHARHQQSRSDNGQHTQRWGGRDQPTARPDRAAPQAQQQRSWTPQARPQQPQQQRTWTRQERPQQAQQQQRSWTQQRGNWSDPARQQQQRAPEAQQTQRWGASDQRTERNRTYGDRDRNTTYRSTDRNWRDNRSGTTTRNWRDGNRDGRSWDRNWRGNNRYDWQRYRSTNRNAYHIGRYYSPYRNYNYRRLSIGFGLDSLFYSSRYWINDPWQYRLPEAYGPYRWVRYYDDALLVDIYSGEVVDVINRFFW
jgi:hypothetical protein